MGPFEIAAVWSALPSSVKAKVPSEVASAFDALAAAIVAYKVAITAYDTATKMLESAKQVQTVASLPPNPEIAVTVASQESAKTSFETSKASMSATPSPISSFLDTEMPA